MLFPDYRREGRSDVWLTPPRFIRALGPFDFDPCGHPESMTADVRICLPDDGLSANWDGRVWLNPPYDRRVIGRWLRKMARHNHGTALLFARTDSAAWQESVFGKAQALLFLRGRVRFHTPDGVAGGRGVAPSVLAAYGDLDTEKLAGADLDGQLVLLNNANWAVVHIPQTWRELVSSCFGASSRSLEWLYDRLADHPKARGNQHWRAKIRQVVQGAEFVRLDRGLYALRG